MEELMKAHIEFQEKRYIDALRYAECIRRDIEVCKKIVSDSLVDE